MFACVGNDDDLRAVVLGDDGAFAGDEAGRGLRRPHDRVGRGRARAARRGDRRGLHFVDAPVSGGKAGAVNGALTVMCGGDAEAFEPMRPVALNFAKAVTRLGASGAGQLAKMVNQIAIAGLVQGLAEAIAFGQRPGST